MDSRVQGLRVVNEGESNGRFHGTLGYPPGNLGSLRPPAYRVPKKGPIMLTKIGASACDSHPGRATAYHAGHEQTF